mgnify:CR=1 FL=1
MYKMNSWKKEVTLESQANTFIERRFEVACSYLTGGSNILNEWRARKEEYISYTNSVVFDFQHYSRHDVTHSVNILESIELILGQNRVEKLSAGDLWLLLECAYYHDIGMALNYVDLKKVWESADFKEYLEEILSEKQTDIKDAALWYKQADNLLQDRFKLEEIEEEDEIIFQKTWPVDMERKILFLVGEYIRRNHAMTSQRYLYRFGDANIIQRRLYQLVGEISAAHGADFEAVLSMKKEAKGFGIDKIHPRFVAELLRIGDLLDMDNNRFNLHAIEHYGTLPWSSEIHLRKHKAMSHILISERKITAEAEEENLDVCKVTNDWFQYINAEVKNLICYWNEMAPEDIGGCIMQMPECKIFHPKYPIEFKSSQQRQFEVDKTKLTELLIGTNIYDSDLEFLREYIQNALDATKMQIWMDLSKGEYKHDINSKYEGSSEFSPFDLSSEIYSNYAIDVIVDFNMNEQKVELTVKDKGIGIEEECIDIIAKIGMGWNGRKRYRSEIKKMPEWLRPTGGFGIGVQSIFMISDSVEIKTKAEFEKVGHKIVMHSPRTSGNISVETGNITYSRGTSVKVSIDLDIFQNLNNKYKDTGKSDWKNTPQLGKINFEASEDVFDRDSICEYVIKVIRSYLEVMVEDSFIPIRIVNAERNLQKINNKYTGKIGYWQNERLRDSEKRITDGEWEYRCIYDINKDELILWNQTESIYTYIKRASEDEKNTRRCVLCFKNILISKPGDVEIPKYIRYFDMCMDFMGQKVEDVLMVHRNSFSKNFKEKINEYFESVIRVFFKYMQIKNNEGISEKNFDSEFPLSPDYVATNQIDFLKSILKDNLWKFPMPVIRELYFEDISNELIDNSIEQDETIRICRLKFDKDKEKDKSGQVVLEWDFESIKIVTKQLNRLLYKNDGIIFVTSSNINEPVQTKISKNIVNEWFANITKNTKAFTGKLIGERNEILESLSKNEFIIFAEEDLVKLILESPKLNKKLVEISDLITFYQIELRREEEKVITLNEKEFYNKSYSDGSNPRYISANTSMNEMYAKLIVGELPYEYKIGEKGPYVISPISKKICVILSMLHSSGKQYFYEEFEKMIIDNTSYQTLIHWVYNHQINRKKYTIEEIDQEYRKYIRNIYQFKISGN